MNRPGRRRAMALLLVLPLLSLLAMLATLFVSLSHLELATAKTYVDTVRARSIAKSGIDGAIGRLRSMASSLAYDSAKYDPGTGVGAWVFRNDADSGVGTGMPLINATTGIPAQNPSFKSGVTAYGHTYSGLLGGTYMREGDYYVLKMVDSQSKLNLNSPHQADKKQTQPNFVAMLDTLLAEIKNDFPAPALPVELTGQAIFDYRTTLGGTYANVDELAMIPGLPGGGMSPAQINLLGEFLTTLGWRDDSVIEPKPDAGFPAGDSTLDPWSQIDWGAIDWSTFDWGEFWANPPGASNLILRSHATDNNYPGRYPVNLNTATRPVLVAVLNGIGGYRLRAKSWGTPAKGEPTIILGKEPIDPIDVNQARQLADAIIAAREATPFKSWAQFETWIEGKLGDPRPRRRAQEKMVVANANPNTRCSKFNPDLGAAVRYSPAYDRNEVQRLDDPDADVDYLVDKLDLNPGTTEFCFSSSGYFELDAVGRVMRPNVMGGGVQLVAESQIRVTMRLWDVYRQTSQRDFSKNRLAQEQNPSVYTYPVSQWDYYGATSSAIAPYNQPGGNGIDPGGTEAVHGAAVDGYLELSPEWETSPAPGARWYANYRRGTNLVYDDGTYRVMNQVSYPWGEAGQGGWTDWPYKFESWAGSGQVDYYTGADNTFFANWNSDYSIWRGADLMVDGILTWSRGQGAYMGWDYGQGEASEYNPPLSLGALPGGGSPDKGTVEFWVKPASTHGSNEVYLGMVSPTVIGSWNGAHEGLAWRVERYGTELYSIRFYWFDAPNASTIKAGDRARYPDDKTHKNDPDSECEGFAYYQQSIDISNWRGGEWHKIRHVFPSRRNTDVNGHKLRDHGLVGHDTFVDDVLMGNDVYLQRDRKHPNPGDESDEPGWASVVGDPGWDSMTTIVFQTVGSVSIYSNIMNLSTMDKFPRLIVGGNRPHNDQQRVLYQLDVTVDPYMNRYSNTTIDEVRFYRDDQTPSSSWNRFAAGGGTFEGRFPAVPAGGTLGTLSYSVYYPQYWNNIDLGRGSVRMSYATSANTAWVSGGPDDSGETYDLQSTPVGGAPIDVHYQLNFQPSGSPTVLSPVVDDVTLTVIRPKFLTWREVIEN